MPARALWSAALALVIVGPARGAEPPERPEVAEGAVGAEIDALPYARLLVEAGVAARPAEELRVSVDRLLSRLLVDDERANFDRSADLHALMRLIVEVRALEGLGGGAELARVSATTAYLAHLMGFAYATRPNVRDAIEALPTQVPAERRAVFEALVESVRRLRAVGGRWLERAMREAVAAHPRDATLHNQRGMWRLREDQHTAAAEAFALAFRASERPRHALNLYDALLAAGRDADAAALAKRVVREAPATKARLEAMAAVRADLRATERYEADREAADQAARIAQAGRYWRLDRGGAAILLADELVKAYPDDPEALAMAASIYLGTRKDAALRALLARAAGADGPLDPRRPDARLIEARIAFAVRSRVERRLGKAGDETDEAHLDADLAAIAASGGERGELIAHAARMLEPLARFQVARGDDATRAADEVRARAGEAMAALPRSADARLLALAGYVGINAAADGVRAISGRLDGLARGERLQLESLLARVRLGRAARARDADGVAEARAALDGIAKGVGDKAPAGFDEAAWRYARAIGPVVAEAIGGGPVSLKTARAALGALPASEVAFDGSSAEGKLGEGALAATRGALLARLDEGPEAARALSRARRWTPDEPVARIAAAQAQLMAGDVEGAWELLTAIDVAGARPTEAFAVHDWLGRCADIAGEVAERRRHAASMVTLWEEAEMPEDVATGALLAVFLGDFDVGIVLEPGEPLRVRLMAAPVVALLPAAPLSRADVEALAKP